MTKRWPQRGGGHGGGGGGGGGGGQTNCHPTAMKPPRICSMIHLDGYRNRPMRVGESADLLFEDVSVETESTKKAPTNKRSSALAFQPSKFLPSSGVLVFFRSRTFSGWIWS